MADEGDEAVVGGGIEEERARVQGSH